MAIFSESRMVGFLSNSDLLGMMKGASQSSDKVEGDLTTAEAEPDIDGVESLEDPNDAQTKLAEALKDAGAEGLTAKEIADVGVTQNEAVEALNNIDDAEVVSRDPEIASIQKNLRKGVFATVGEFFSDAWEKLRGLFNR